MNQLISNKGVCRTAPATPGLLIRQDNKKITVAILSYYVDFLTMMNMFLRCVLANTLNGVTQHMPNHHAIKLH